MWLGRRFMCLLTELKHRLGDHVTGRQSDTLQTWVCASSPGVPLHLLLVVEAREARADARGHPGTDFVEEPLEGEETSHRDGEDKLAEWVHGHPTTLQQDGEKEFTGLKKSCCLHSWMGG